MAQYRLRPNFKHREGGKLLEAGTLVEMSAERYAGLKDRFEPVAQVDATQPTGVGAKPVGVAGDRPVLQPEPLKETVGSTLVSTTSDVNYDEVLSGNVGDVQEEIAKVDDSDILNAMLHAEKAGKNRKGVVDAIEAQLEAIEE